MNLQENEKKGKKKNFFSETLERIDRFTFVDQFATKNGNKTRVKGNFYKNFKLSD